MPRAARSDWLSAWEGFRVKADDYRELDDERVLVLLHVSGRGKISRLQVGQTHRVLRNEFDSLRSERGQPVPTRRVLISQRLAKLLFANEDAIGKRVGLWGNSTLDAEVIGVVADSRERGPAAGA